MFFLYSVSDYDDEDSKDAIHTTTKSSFIPTSISSFPALSKPVEFPVGPSRYNFIEQLGEDNVLYLTASKMINITRFTIYFVHALLFFFLCVYMVEVKKLL